MNRLILFDVDGVLLDSLGPHLQICEDKRREYGLDLRIPAIDDFREMVRAGVAISPMVCFFKAVGFPDHLAERATDDYQRIFMNDYAPQPFLAVHDVLSVLRDNGLTLGIVTSNVEANVVRPLARSMALFRSDCILTKSPSEDFSKANAIETAVDRCRVMKSEVTYVGDQPADARAAAAAGVHFLGAAYGWGITGTEPAFDSVRRPEDIAPYFLGSRRSCVT